MARLPRTKNPTQITDTRFDDKRTNNPPAALAGEGSTPLAPKLTAPYSPRRTPELQRDCDARLEVLLTKAASAPLSDEEVAELRRLYSDHEPWLEWAGKREARRLEVDPVALHIHERVAAQAILEAAQKQSVQRGLFAEPDWDYQKQTAFYQHEMDWANRLILGDSLQVMASLARRENLAGKVQMIYLDPPYGIKFASNFQPKIGQRDVKDKDADLTREPETVRAYRDTWQLGIHSYLTYLRDRLMLARELLHDSGSIFVQISDENLHRVRCVLDEVFGSENALSVIAYRKTSNLTAEFLPTSIDWIIWYAKDKSQVKYHQLYSLKNFENVTVDSFGAVQFSNGLWRRLSNEEKASPQSLPSDCKLFGLSDLTSSHFYDSPGFVHQGKTFTPKNRYWSTSPTGMRRLAGSDRLAPIADTLRYKRHFEDFPVTVLNNVWNDIGAGTQSEDRVYAVQTATKAIERCLLMTTDPGDLVFDPTCGSGTTAVVAETWGRRWITCDTSRVALSIARQRLLTSRFDQYRLQDESRGVRGGFKCKTVPHVTLKSIAQNPHLDPIFAHHEPLLESALQTCNAALLESTPEIRRTLRDKLARKERESKRSVSDADRRRWVLPPAIEIAAEGRDAPGVRLRGHEADERVHEGGHLAEGPPAAISIAGHKDGHQDQSVHAGGHLAEGPSAAISIAGQTTGHGFQHWTVPFDTDDDWPPALRDAVLEYRRAWRAKMDAVNACIAANAESETLVDRPEIVSNVVRVSGPFTVESVQPPEISLGEAQVPDWEDEAELETFEVREAIAKGAMETQNVAAYIDNLIALLRQDGVTFLGNRHVKFSRLEAASVPGAAVHAEGEWHSDDGEMRAAISFGPQYGAITARQVEDVQRAAYQFGYNAAIFAGFAFEPEASSFIERGGRVQLHLAHIRPDINPGMSGLLKDTPGSQLFTVFGSPRVSLSAPDADGMHTVTMEGVDIYDPVSNKVDETRQEKVAAWFLDSDYDGKVFCISQAFFPDRSAWDKLERALKGAFDSETFARLSGTTSLPFARGEHGRVAVKVIDPRGNEVMKVVGLD